MDLNTSIYGGLTGTQLTFFVLDMLVISDISVLLHMYDLLELRHYAYHNYFIILFAGFHIEKASFNTLGDLLDCSGWTEALVQAGVATPGTADSFIKAAHVTRTRWVTASVLYLLRQECYTKYCDELDEGQVTMSVEDWCATRADTSPQSKFWSIILKLEPKIMIYVRSLRERDFMLYIDALTEIVPWFFALWQTNYARWIPVHLRDMVALEDKHPDVFPEFMAGNFTGGIGEVTVDGKDMEVVPKFVFLGALITKDGICEKEVRRRIAMGKPQWED